MDAGSMALDHGRNAWGPAFRSPPRSPFEGPLPSGGGYGGSPVWIWLPSFFAVSSVPKRRDGPGRPFASCRINRGRRGFPDLARSGWHCGSPAPLLSLWVVRAAIQFPFQMKKMSIGSRCYWIDWIAMSIRSFLKFAKGIDSRSSLCAAHRSGRETTFRRRTFRGARSVPAGVSFYTNCAKGPPHLRSVSTLCWLPKQSNIFTIVSSDRKLSFFGSSVAEVD